MDYVIKNNKDVYIRLNENGSPVTCSEKDRTLFEQSKANNILGCLPKTLRRMNFKVVCVQDIQTRILQNKNYQVSNDIKQWVEKFGICGDIMNEAKERLDFLLNKLREVDNEFIDILHIVEIDNPKDLYGGWLEYKHIRENREKRRQIKDEILIIENVLEEVNPSSLQRERIQKAIDGLFTRKYTFRIVEEDYIHDTL